MHEGPIFDHEKLDVYQIELLFVAWVAEDGKRQGKTKRLTIDPNRARPSFSFSCSNR